MSDIKKVVLAYSGGLDTSVIIPWLKEHYDNCEVIAVCGNVGQTGELDGLEDRAKASGASKLYIEDLTDEFVDDYIIPTVQAGADYEGYLLGTSFARPVLAKRVVEIAKREHADAVSHGSTGKGNDQVRFELAIMHFAPDMKIITPWREWDITDEAGGFDVTFFGALDGGEADCRLVCRLQASRFKQFPKFRLSYLQGEKFVEQFPEKFLPLTGNTGGETSFSPVFPGFLRGLTVELNEI